MKKKLDPSQVNYLHQTSVYVGLLICLGLVENE